jgi:hypothetical protein
MIFNIIEEVGSKSNSKRKFLSFPGLPQAHGASYFARGSPGNTHPRKRKQKKKKNAFSSKEKWGPNSLSFFLAFFWGSTNLLPDSSVSQPVHMKLQLVDRKRTLYKTSKSSKTQSKPLTKPLSN